MSQEDFNLEKDQSAEQNKHKCADICPLVQISPDVWRKLLKPSFSSRHPLLFWLFLSIFIVVITIVTQKILFNGNDISLSDNQPIALVSIRGTILDVESTLEWIEKIGKNPHIKGVLLRVDSPGGGAAASQEVYAALAQLATKIPIVASMGSMAASGGLMVCMAAEKIYANPSTVTGSIGVRMDIPQIQKLMEKVGLDQETIVSAPYKDTPSYMRPLGDKAKEYLEQVIMNMHEQFVDIVARGRKISHDEAVKLASGKIFTGQQAMALHLVDEMGGQNDALRWLIEKTGVSADVTLLKQEEQYPKFTRFFKSALIFLIENVAKIDPGVLMQDLKEPEFLY